ncbi:hypothetical protein ACTWQF_16315 [Streptomyces sp. 8N114]|uniref:hypothetical protein n=1 Tax=Streptomyces sp. 8N114 TaxID=3457419 RepID=UPI003FD0D1D9
MDPEVAALAGTAGTALVTMLTTEAWQAVRDGFSSLWCRAQPERAEAIDSELVSTRNDLLAAQAEGDLDAHEELGAEWQGRIRRLLVTHPEEMEALRRLLNELEPQMPPVTPSVTQHATASGHARVYQAGRDQNLGQR